MIWNQVDKPRTNYLALLLYIEKKRNPFAWLNCSSGLRMHWSFLPRDKDEHLI